MGVPLRDRTMKISFGNEPRKTPERKTNLACVWWPENKTNSKAVPKSGTGNQKSYPVKPGRMWRFEVFAVADDFAMDPGTELNDACLRE